jgi:hypothetical protein
VGALFDESAAVEHEDRVGGEDRGQAVGDDDGRPCGEQRLRRGMDQLLGHRVEVR